MGSIQNNTADNMKTERIFFILKILTVENFLKNLKRFQDGGTSTYFSLVRMDDVMSFHEASTRSSWDCWTEFFIFYLVITQIESYLKII